VIQEKTGCGVPEKSGGEQKKVQTIGSNLVCIYCKKSLPRSSFSNSQLNNKKESKKCKECVTMNENSKVPEKSIAEHNIQKKVSGHKAVQEKGGPYYKVEKVPERERKTKNEKRVEEKTQTQPLEEEDEQYPVCICCKKSLHMSSFSNSQLKKIGGKKCRECILYS